MSWFNKHELIDKNKLMWEYVGYIDLFIWKWMNNNIFYAGFLLCYQNNNNITIFRCCCCFGEFYLIFIIHFNDLFLSSPSPSLISFCILDVFILNINMCRNVITKVLTHGFVHWRKNNTPLTTISDESLLTNVYSISTWAGSSLFVASSGCIFSMILRTRRSNMNVDRYTRLPFDVTASNWKHNMQKYIC